MANKRERDPQKIRIYKEIKAALWRDKNKKINDILESRKFLDEIIEDVDLIVNDYERTRLLFKQYIFTGTLPEYDDEYDESELDDADEEEDIEEDSED